MLKNITQNMRHEFPEVEKAHQNCKHELLQYLLDSRSPHFVNSSDQETHTPLLCLQLEATLPKPYYTPYLQNSNEQWHPIQNNVIEQTAPLALSEQEDVMKLDACHSVIDACYI